MMMKPSSSFSPSLYLIVVVLLLLLLPFSSAQQPYINNVQLNCYGTNSSSALGYTCNALSSCSSFLTIRAKSPYITPALIAFLLSTEAANISRLNSVSDVSPFADDQLILIPISCSCSNRFYQHNASYTLKTLSENYFTVANDTYQGLSTCQALINQNPIDSRRLAVGDKLVVPLRCACPTLNQTRTSISYLISYLIMIGDDIPTIAKIFGADYQSILAANELNEKSTIYPFTTLLIPLSREPTKILIPPSSPPNISDSPPPSSRSSNAWLYAGVGVSMVLLLGFVLCLLFCLKRRLRRQKQPMTKKLVSEITEYGDPPFKKTAKTETLPLPTPSPLASSIRGMLDWMTVYSFEELNTATGGFDEEHLIRGSVYHGVINGETAAIKKLEGDVTNEINILKHISHSNVIKLSGFCLYIGNTYLVYEFAEMGSVSNWLQHKKSGDDFPCLSWMQRIQIACDVADGLNYLHNYANPPFIHKNLKSRNILLGRNFRAKVANFGMERPVEEGQQQLTRHVVDTQGYMSPEYLEHGLSTPKLDVFSFGVVLLELLSGKEAIFVREDEMRREALLWTTIEDVLNRGDVKSKLRGFVDRCLKDDYPFDLAFSMAELAKGCVSPDPASRPTMDVLLVSLSAIYNSTLDWDPEYGASSHFVSAIYRR